MLANRAQSLRLIWVVATWITTNQARKVLLKDEQLSACNIGVTVKDKVATIWGVIPSADIAKRAEDALKKVSGIVAVVNDCKIVPPPNPLAQQVADAVKRLRERDEEPAKPVAPVTTTGTAKQVVAKPSTDGFPLRPLGEPDLVIPREPEPSRPGAVLLAPIPTLEAPSEIADPLERVRRSETRFQKVVLEVRGDVVRISGSVPKIKDAWDLAEKLNSIAGVRQVILGQVQER